ncbi:MAG: hypothetical protein QM579_04530 [Desulfovibrio sp.]|uniref:DUF7424 family protein n=1 Tax=Desulfovibrio sp. TaxID=885 RepID=UPI0039E61255
MKRYFVFPLLLFVFVLSGCKLEHNSRVKQSQLIGEVKTIEATVRVEIPSCTHYQDKTKPSDNLIKTTELIKKLFPDSEFEDCKSENMKSMATYLTQMNVGTLPPDVKDFKPKGVSVLRNQDGVVFFCLSDEIRAKIADGRKNAMSKDLALYVNIRFNNDTEKDAKIFPYAVYVSGKPFAGLPSWGNNVVVKSKGTETFTLSNVASDFAVVNGIVPVFNEPVQKTDGEKK